MEKYRVSYNNLGAFFDAGTDAYIGWDESFFYFTHPKNGLLTIPLAHLQVQGGSVGGNGRSIQLGKYETNFTINAPELDKGYGFSFIGTKETAVLGISQDYHEHAKIFVAFVATQLPGNKDRRFNSDGTYTHKRSDLALAIVAIAVLLLVAALALKKKLG